HPRGRGRGDLADSRASARETRARLPIRAGDLGAEGGRQTHPRGRALARPLAPLAAAAQLLLALRGAFLVQLRLALSARGPLAGDRGLGPALLGLLAVMARGVTLGLVLNLPQPAALSGTTSHRDDDPEDDHCCDDDGDDRNRGHLNSFG